MAARGGTLGPGDRIRRPRDFQRASRLARRRVSPGFVLLVASVPRRKGEARVRLGLTVSRRVGGSVVRNRIKRRIREWFRQARGEMAGCVDVIVIARGGAAQLESAEISSDLSRLVRSL